MPQEQIKDSTVLSVHELLENSQQLAIPSYQRPYRWGTKNISNLFNDLATHQTKSAYRLGSVVFHQHEDNKDSKTLDIVDGQQRTLTLMLTVKALLDKYKETHLQRQNLRQQLTTLHKPINDFIKRQTFPSRDSEINLRQNYLEVRRLVERPEFGEQQIDFLLNRCEVVCFVLEDISEAFQFFDSQNARGRDLAPHDLLKAFHLREFSQDEAELKAKTVEHWENLPSDKLHNLFALYLYRLRKWSDGKSARHFGKGQVDLFKGVNLDQTNHFPYVKPLRVIHNFVDAYNSEYQRKVDGQHMAFPFHLNQTIVNGRRFFEMAEHYQKLVTSVVNELSTTLGETQSQQAHQILETLSKYKRRHRTGDRYVRAMFDCALIAYIDKFGHQGLSLAIEKCFIWAYRCRMTQQVVQLATMDNYVLNHNLIRAIRDAHQPTDLQSFPLPHITKQENKNNHRSDPNKDELVKLFIKMKYYE